MEIKKSEKASLQNKRLLFVEIGFVVALLAVLLAFEWSSKEKADTSLLAENKDLIEEEIIPITGDSSPAARDGKDPYSLRPDRHYR